MEVGICNDCATFAGACCKQNAACAAERRDNSAPQIYELPVA
jgi:hypothetical protein